jgi:hypothetical protein
MRTYGQTGRTKLIADYLNSTNTRINLIVIIDQTHIVLCCPPPFFFFFIAQKVSNIHLVTKDKKIVPLTNLLGLLLAGRVVGGVCLVRLLLVQQWKTYTLQYCWSLNARGKPKFLAEACVIDCRSSAADTHGDILTHCTDSKRVRLVGGADWTARLSQLVKEQLFQRQFSCGVCLSGKSRALISAYRPPFLIITLFSSFIYYEFLKSLCSVFVFVFVCMCSRACPFYSS